MDTGLPADDIGRAFEELRELTDRLASDTAFQDSVRAAASLIHERLSAGGKLLTIGNGGSAAEAQHLAGEFVGRFRRERQGFPATALSADGSALTCIGNDYSYEQVFSRQVEANGKPGDILVALTTSGNSANVIEAVKAAKARGLATVCLLGKGGGAVRGMADLDVIVPSDSTARIQEIHLLIIHAACEAFDSAVLGRE